MTLQETQRYVRSQLLQLGWGPNPVITRQAWELIYAQTRGNQDTLDQLCNRLASLGKPGENHKITKDAVKIAIRELKVFNELPPIPVLGDDSEPLLEDGNRGRDSDAISIEQLAAELEAKARVMPPADPSTRDPAPEEEAQSAVGKPKVLIIDDSLTVRTVIHTALEDQFDCVEAKDGEVGWNMLLSDAGIVLAIVDLEMPALDGYGLIRRIRAAHLRRIATVPIIVVTATTDTIAKKEAYLAGADDFMTKACDALELLVRVRTHYQLSQAKSALLSHTKSALDQQRRTARKQAPVTESAGTDSLDTPSLDDQLSSTSELIEEGHDLHRGENRHGGPRSADPTGRLGQRHTRLRPLLRQLTSILSWTRTRIQPTTAMTLIATALVLMVVGYIVFDSPLQPESIMNKDSVLASAGAPMVSAANLPDSEKRSSEEFASANSRSEKAPVSEGIEAKPPADVATQPEKATQLEKDVVHASAQGTSPQKPTQPKEAVARVSASLTPSSEKPRDLSSPEAQTRATTNKIEEDMPNRSPSPPAAFTQARLSVALQSGPPVSLQGSKRQSEDRIEGEARTPTEQSLGPRAAERHGATVTPPQRPTRPAASTNQNVLPSTYQGGHDRAISQTSSQPPPVLSQAAQSDSARSVRPQESLAVTRTKEDEAASSSITASVDARVTNPETFTGDPFPTLSVPSTSVAVANVETTQTLKRRPPVALTNMELNAILDKFVTTYAAGDLDRFITLFAKEARTNVRTSRAQIRQDYAALFRTTDKRRMTFRKLIWDLKNDKAQGRGNFEVKVQRKGESRFRIYTGSLAIQVERRGAEFRITRLYHYMNTAAAKSEKTQSLATPPKTKRKAPTQTPSSQPAEDAFADK